MSSSIRALRRCAFVGVLAISVISPSFAQTFLRTFPQDALRGRLMIVQPPEATLNGTPARLAPGVRIRTQQNMIEMSAKLIDVKLVVNYTIDTYGLIKDVWILTPEEASRKPWPTTIAEAQAWQFDWQSQTWSKP